MCQVFELSFQINLLPSHLSYLFSNVTFSCEIQLEAGIPVVDGVDLINQSVLVLELSVSFSLCCSVIQLCPTLRHHGLQHTRLPCPSLSPRACPSSCPLSW